MRARNVILLLILVLMGLFAGFNWPLFIKRESLSLLVTRVEAPFGLILLILMGLFVIGYFLYSIGLEQSALLEVKKYARELLAQRKLADDAEASRFSELKKYLEAEFEAMKQVDNSKLLARLEQAEENLRDDIEKAGNTLAAYIGELEDQITGQDRHPPLEPPRKP